MEAIDFTRQLLWSPGNWTCPALINQRGIVKNKTNTPETSSLAVSLKAQVYWGGGCAVLNRLISSLSAFEDCEKRIPNGACCTPLEKKKQMLISWPPPHPPLFHPTRQWFAEDVYHMSVGAEQSRCKAHFKRTQTLREHGDKGSCGTYGGFKWWGPQLSRSKTGKEKQEPRLSNRMHQKIKFKAQHLSKDKNTVLCIWWSNSQIWTLGAREVWPGRFSEHKKRQIKKKHSIIWPVRSPKFG